MFAHSIPAHQRGSVRFLGVALFLPSYPLSSFGVVPGSCVSSIIPSSWNIGICGHGPRLTDGCSCPGNGARSPGSGANPNSSRWSRQSRSPFLGFLHRENLVRSQLGLDFICFSRVAGASGSFRMISLIVLMWKKKKNSQAVLVASKYLSSLGNRAESEAWVHIQDEFLFLLVLSPLLSTRKQGSLLKSSLPSSTRSRVPAPVICIPVYERFSLQSVGSGKRLSVDIGTVKKTSWSLFLIATGLWTESDSFLCCIFSPLALRTSVVQCFFSYFLPPWRRT